MDFELLDEDVRRKVLLLLDGESLARLQRVNTWYYDYCGDNDLWLRMLQRRFHVKTVQNRHLSNSGPVSWKNIYVNWATIRRMPSSPFCGQRFPVLARNIDKNVHVWVIVRPSENCTVSRGCVTLRIVVQNTSTTPMRVVSSKLSTHLRDEANPVHQEVNTLGYFRADQVGKNLLDHKSMDPILNMYDFVVLQSKVNVPQNCVFEPEALECFSSLNVPLEFRSIAEKKRPISCARCDFAENVIWKHYERLPGGFWVFLDRERCF